MPVLLTTAFNPGDIDPNKTYPRAQITSFTIITAPVPGPAGERTSSIVVHYEFGDVVAGNWVPGDATPRRSAYLTGQDYTDMLAEAATAGENYLIYAAAKRVLYQWLIDSGALAGTIE